MRKERHIYSDYVKRVRFPSEINDKMVELEGYEETLTCPRCGQQQGGIEHGHVRICPKCSLKMQRWGNCLEVTIKN